MPADSRRSAASARAFAPGHVTGLFAPAHVGRDPRARGSIGAGIVLELGVTADARWRPSPRPRLIVRSETRRPLPISEDVARRLAAERGGILEVDLRHDLPIGQGFGMSAAGALATGLAVGKVLGRPRREIVATAHLADLFGGGGLGGVAAILGGGLEVRSAPGIPPWGAVRHGAFPRSVFIGVTGAPMPSPRLLGDPGFLDRVRAAAGRDLARLARRPDPDAFLRASERFTEALGLAPPRLRAVLAALRATGARSAQAMFGRSFYAVPRGAAGRRRLIAALARARLPTVELRADGRGARLLGGRPGESLLPRPRLARLP